MLTVFLIAWPLVSVLLIMLFGARNAKFATLGSTVLQLLVTLYAVCTFQHNAEIQFEFNQPWVADLGINFHVGMDGISLMMVLLTNLLLPLITLSSFRMEFFRPVLFYGLMLVMQSA